MPDQNQEWRLKPLHIASLPEDFAISEAGITIGRDSANSVCLDSESYPDVSAHHCRIALREGIPVLEDLESTNGTLVGGEPIRRVELNHGDVVQLGSSGPRFAVVKMSESLDMTEAIRRPDSSRRGRGMGTETLRVLKRELGIAGPDGLGQDVRSRTRRNTILATVLFLITCGLGVWGFVAIQRSSEADRDQIQREAQARQRDLLKQLADSRSQLESIWHEHARKVDSERVAWEEEKSELQTQRAALESRLETLVQGDESTAEEIRRLQIQLKDTTTQLSKYDPLNLEQERLRKVSEVVRCVVMVECKETMVDPVTGDVLHIDITPEGAMDPNFDGRGQEISKMGSGSGFTLNDQGWILTNAHVVNKKESGPPFSLGPDIPLEPQITLHVVYSGESVRRPAKLVDYASDGDEDLALLKIEPFEGMFHLEDFSLDISAPPPSSDVFLLGFPLGTSALQEGDRVIASTFRGILSRVVGPYFQVDAAVHPGNSGGPLIDAQGNVLGVVVGMQVVDQVAGSSSMGFVIPIAEAAQLWPPEEVVPEDP